MLRKKEAFAAVSSLLLTFLTAGPALSQTPGGTLRAYHVGNSPSGSLHEESSIATLAPYMSVFNNLVVFDPTAKFTRAETVIPDLASEWSWSADNRKLTFKLRDGVKWHDGKPFTSADVKCTWDTLSGKRDAGWRKNPRKAWWWNIEEITTNGDHEVTFALKQPQPSFIQLLAAGYSPVYSCHVSARDMRAKPIGTGPFKIAEIKPNDSMKLVKNPDYWKKGLPYLDAIEWKVIPNRSTRMLAFIAGEFDLTFPQDVTIPLLRDIKAQAPNAYCEVNPSNIQGQLLVNREAEPFDNEKIRRAMMLTLDRKAFIDILSEGENRIGGVMLPPPEGLWASELELLAQVPGYGPDVKKNRDEGRAIMRELGYGPDKPLKIKVSTLNSPTYRDPSVILIDQLREVFIEGELEVLEGTVWFAKLARKDFHVGMNNSGIGIDDPDVVLYEGYSCGSERNYTNYCNKELQEKFYEQSATFDMEKRRKLVAEIDRTLQNEAARPIIHHARGATCWQPQVKGITLFTNNEYAPWRFEGAWLQK
jgi:peptide/nickel transport system substrate-binding protein